MAMQNDVLSSIDDLPSWQLRAFPIAVLILRVTFGLLFLTNGIAKLPGLDSVNYIPFPGFLISYDGAQNSLDSDTRDHPIPLYRDVVEKVVLDNYTPFGVGLVVTELAMGVMLISGAFASLGALIAFGSLFHLWFANLGRYQDRQLWAWEGPIEWLPLLALIFLASGRFYGLDRKVAARLPAPLRRWPFTG